MQSSKGESNVREVTEVNWKDEVLSSELPVLVDFWASWCGPCRMLAPTIDQIAKENKFDIKVAKVNVDENLSLAESIGIQSIPTLLIFKNGKIVKSTLGAQPKAELEKFISNAINS